MPHQRSLSVFILAILLMISVSSCAGFGAALPADEVGVSEPGPTAHEPARPKIVLKLDDVGLSRRPHPGWLQVIDYLDSEGVVGTIGLVGKGLEDPDPSLIDWLKARARDGHEIWNHGYCHCRPSDAQPTDGRKGAEFRGTPYEFQFQSLKRTQDLAKEKLGLTLVTFGAPYNSTDDKTVAAIAALPDLKVWIFKETQVPTDLLVLNRISAVNIEYPVHIPDFDQFKMGFGANQDADLLVIQGHPRSWVDEPKRFDEFKKIIDYLKRQGVEFTTPSEYAASL